VSATTRTTAKPTAGGAPPAPVFDAEQARDIYRLMSLARQFEEQLGEVFASGKLAGWFHSCVGHEATGATLRTYLRETDHLIPYHRSRVALFAKGMTAREVAAEMMGRTTAQSKGRGGDGHIVHPGRRIYGMSGVLGASIPIAAGVAYGAKLRGEGEVVISSFGDGTSNRGAVAEGLNLAAVSDLPIVFIVENNLYGEFTPLRDVMRAEHISDRAPGFGIPSAIVDGNDPEASQPAIAAAVQRARDGGGPTLIEALTYRLKGHYEGDPQAYREKDEIAEWTQRDPVLRFRERLVADGRATDEQLSALETEVAAEVTDAMEYGLGSPMPTAEEIVGDVYAGESGI
jgi:acetoin:2,6-dichlorophenolindophenol oxidoreductase subunit alpha